MFEGLSERRTEALRWLAVLTVVGVGWVLFNMPPDFLRENALFTEIVDQISYRILRPLSGVTFYWLLTIEFGVVLAAAIALQYVIPVHRDQKTFSSHFFNDGSWFFYSTLNDAIVKTTYTVWLVSYLEPLVAPVRPAALEALPLGVRFVLSLLIIELLSWAQHYAQHKSPFLWQFHAVHHSQTELNFFSDFRVHLSEYLIRATVIAVPMTVLHMNLPTIVAFMIFERWYSRFYHCNLKTNLGPLKYVLVTPQSHRFHHTKDPEHQDTNFARYFTVWDWVFGTQSKHWNSYPATGISDSEFPLEQGKPSIRFLWLPLIQQFYPIKVLARQGWRRLFGEASIAPATMRTPSE